MAMKVDIIILADPDFYPPTINAANILAEKGYRVRMIGIYYKNAQKQKVNAFVERINYGSHKTGLQNLWQYFSFYIWYWFLVRSDKPDWIIAYDSMAVGPVALSAKFHNIKWLYHNHDILQNPGGWYRLIGWIERKFARLATIVSFPQEDRAINFMKYAKLKRFPVIVYNGPRKGWSAIEQAVHVELEEWVLSKKFIILYQGQFSKYFNLNILIQSLRYLPDEFALVLIGRELEPGICETYRHTIYDNDLSKRVKILSSVPHHEIPSITAYCDLGVAKLGSERTIPLNDYYLTGASNKISEYLAFGLPVLMADTEVNRQFYSKYNFAAFVNGNSCESIALTIKDVADDRKGSYSSLKNNAYKAARETFNYDIQFSKIISVLENQ